MSLIEKMLKTGSKGSSTLMSEAEHFADFESVTTDLPILNLAFSGKLDGGITPGLTLFCGESRTFKSALSLLCLKSYLDKYSDAVGILYDSEYGITPAYLKSFGIDTQRIIHIPVEHIEQLKFDFVKKLEAINKGDHVFFLVDSIGQLSSKKEVEDAIDEKAVADLSRSRAIRSLMRLITIQLNKKCVPCVMINHVYQSIGTMYSQTVIPGGQAATLSPNQVYVLTKAQEKSSDGELEGWNFTINIHKSRFVKEKMKFPFTVLYDGGIQRTSGLLDLALESGHIVKPSQGWYSRVNVETGEIEAKKYRAKETTGMPFWTDILKSPSFNEFVEKKFRLATSEIISKDSLEEDSLTD